ncbi:MAG: hypothetical protein HOK97_16770 [Deltaproteobacteria bacterium]|jgi:hypothetical protein|nr:hypothetical protein [Deltaproteobacteria bacterium]
MNARSGLGRLLFILVITPGLSACLSAEEGSLPFDDRAEVPPLPESFREFRTGDMVIPPNTESMLCYFLAPEPETLYARDLRDYQGASGHHVILFRTIQYVEPGTIRDCTEVEDMGNLIPIIAPVKFGLGQFPDGMAIKVPEGAQLVIQQHVLNLRETEIVTNDALHLALLPQEDVEIQAGFLGLSAVDFEIAPHSTQTLELDCEVPADMNILTIGGHMHESGMRYEALSGSLDNLSPLLQVESWLPIFRDEPPVAEWPLESPRIIQQGSIIRTICEFENTTDDALSFPEEMCATFGYYYPAIPGRETWLCDGRN